MNTRFTLIVSALLTAMALSGCAILRETPPTYQMFPLNEKYTEAKADPGRVLDERVKLGKTRAGERHGYPVLCGFVDFENHLVWMTRDLVACPPYDETRRHENCHIEASEKGIKDECHDGRSFKEAK